MKNTVYIFGASGFIGRSLVEILAPDNDVITVGRNSEDIFFDLKDSDPAELLASVSSGDFFIFLAAISSPDVCETNSELAHDVNVVKTSMLINELTIKGVKVVFSSSDAVFGNRSGFACEEDDLLPLGRYAVMKAQVENSFFNNSLVKIVRLSYVIGRDDKFCKMLSEAELKGVVVDVYKGFERNVVLLEDVLDGMVSLITHWDSFLFNVVNFSGPTLVSRQQLVETLARDVFSGLLFNVSEAPPEFWGCRAKSISTSCRNFSVILGRSPRGISEIKELW